MAKAKLQTNPSATKTLRAMNIGDEILLKTKDVKSSAVYRAARRLKDEGYKFSLSERGLVNSIIVRRLA